MSFLFDSPLQPDLVTDGGYRNLGVHWTLTILGGLSALLVPVPVSFLPRLPIYVCIESVRRLIVP